MNFFKHPPLLTEEEIIAAQPLAEGADVFADHRSLTETWQRPKGLLGWLSSTGHKEIATRYVITAFIFFSLAGLLAAAMRIQLAFPENQFLGPDLYNQFFSVHGTSMMFLFAVPVMEGMALYFIPLMVGTRNVAFPRMNLYGYYSYLAGGLLLFGGLAFNVGVDTGWFSYVPLAGPEYSPGKRVDFWAQMITFTEIAALIGAVEIIVTVMKHRAPGMSLNRIPIYAWAMVVTSFMIVFAMPSIMLASGMLAMDRLTNVNTHFFNQAEGGDPLLWQHLFWFFGHPEVYIIFIPATGFISTIIPVFSRRPIYGYTGMVLALVSIAFIAFGLWVHHMFATPLPRMGQAFFSAASMMIAIPNGIQIFCWIATLWSGKPQFKTPLMFALGFIAIFVMGGLSGIILASVAIDRQVHDTFFVVAHFHYVLIGGAVFPLFGAIYYWYPKWTGRMLNETLGKWNFWLFFIGFNVTFFPMHQLGLKGMPRRVYTYVPETGWQTLNMVATGGAILMGLSILLFYINVAWSRRNGPKAGPNPWGGETLEWMTSSPPPPYNYLYTIAVDGRSPAWENGPDTPVITGLETGKREILTTTVLEGKPEHRYELTTDSIYPLVLAGGTTISLLGGIFNPWFLPGGMVAGFIALLLWFWRDNEPNHVREAREDHPSGHPPLPHQLAWQEIEREEQAQKKQKKLKTEPLAGPAEGAV